MAPPRARRRPGVVCRALALPLLVLTGIAATAACSSGPQETLTGRVIAYQDVQGLPDTAVTDGTVVVVPLDAVGALWDAAGVDPPQAQEGADLPDDAVTAAGGTTLTLDGKGRFGTDLDPGTYLLCLRPGWSPEFAAGCAELDVPAADVTIATGEIGFSLLPQGS